MANYSTYNCWESMNCDILECPGKFEPETPCWEITKRTEAFNNLSNTCKELLSLYSRE